MSRLHSLLETIISKKVYLCYISVLMLLQCWYPPRVVLWRPQIVKVSRKSTKFDIIQP